VARRGSISPHSVPHRCLRFTSRSLSGTCSAPPPSPNGPYPGCFESHYRHCHLVCSTTLLHYYYHYITTAIPLACFFVSRAVSFSPGPGATASLSSSSSSSFSSPCPRHVSVCSFVRFTEGSTLTHHCHYHYTVNEAVTCAVVPFAPFLPIDEDPREGHSETVSGQQRIPFSYSARRSTPDRK